MSMNYECYVKHRVVNEQKVSICLCIAFSQIGGQIAQGAGTGAAASGDCNSAKRLSVAAEADAKHVGRWQLFC